MSKLVLAARERRNRVLVALSALVAMLAVPAAASAQTTPAYSLNGATDGIVAQVTGVLTDVLPIAGGLIALFVGWKILKRFVKSA